VSRDRGLLLRTVTWAVLGFAAWAPVALAAPESKAPSAAVVPVGEPPAVGADVLRWSLELQDALQVNGQRLLGEPAKLRLLGLESASYGDLDAAYAKARAIASAGEYADAERELRAIVEGLERLFGHADAFPRWSRAMLQLARVEQILSRPEETRRVVDRLLHADPLVSPDPDLFPPSFLSVFDQVREEVRRQPRAKLVVSTGTAGGAIFLEGREVGAGTATLSLPPGPYRIRVVVDEVRLPERTVTLQRGEERLHVDASFAAALKRQPMVALVAAEAGRFRLAAELGAALGVERLYLVTESRSGAERYLVVEVLGGASGCTLDVARLRLASSGPPPGGIAALAAVLAKGESSPLLELGLLQRVQPPASPWREGSACKRPASPGNPPPSAPPPAKAPTRPSKLVRCESQFDCAEVGGTCFEGVCRR